MANQTIIHIRKQRHALMMSTVNFETMAAVERTCEEEINFMLGAEEFDIDRALLQMDGRTMDEKAMTSSHPSSSKLSGNAVQNNMIDSVLEDLDDDLKFDGITFDQNQEDFTGMPSLSSYAPSMPTYGRFNYPPPPHIVNQMPLNGFHNSGSHNTMMPQMFLPPPPPELRFPSDFEPVSHVGMHATGMFNGTDGFPQYPPMPVIFPSDIGLHTGIPPLEPYNDILGPQYQYRRPLKKRRVDKRQFGSPTRPSQSQVDSFSFTEQPASRPYHLVPMKEAAVLDMSEYAVAARNARKSRRQKRAKCHVLRLLGASVSEIERTAVMDSDYNDLYDLSQTQEEHCEKLLNDYSTNFDAKKFVEGVWNGVYLALTTEEKSKKEVTPAPTTESSPSSNSVAAKLIQLMKRKPGFSMNSADGVSSDLSSSSKSNPTQTETNISSKEESPKDQDIIQSSHIVTPTGSSVSQTKKRSLDAISVSHPPLPLVPSKHCTSKTVPSPPSRSSSSSTDSKESSKEEGMYSNADLPEGTDPESRRLRRLMRNRLSAQRSRDRRKKEIEAYTKLKIMKAKQIASLKETLVAEKDGLKKLEDVVNFAKSLLGPDKFAMVVGATQ